MENKVADVLTDLIAQQALVDPATVSPGSVLSELGVTSLSLVEIIMEIEERFEVTIPVDAVQAWNSYKTVGDLIAMGQSLAVKKPSLEV